MTVGDRQAAEAAVGRLRRNSDKRVGENIDEMLRRVTEGKGPGWVRGAVEGIARYRSREDRANREGPALEASSVSLVEEAVARAIGRPVYLVRGHRVDVDSARAEATAWRHILEDSGRILDAALPSVGRIEVENYLGLRYAGTGWVIDEGLIVTNAHVAQLFAEREGAGFRFRLGSDRAGPMRVRIDYREEHERDDVEEMAIESIVWMPMGRTPDVAFLRLGKDALAPARRAIRLARHRPEANTIVGVIGYPGRDYDFWDRELLSRLFGDIYEKKRFAPGNVLGVGDLDLQHDCTTLGGNSGSVLLDLATGEAVGLHYAGVPLVENRAVPAPVVAQALHRASEQTYEVMGMPKNDEPGAAISGRCTVAPDGASLRVTIPIEVTVSIGASGVRAATPRPAAAQGVADGIGLAGLIDKPTPEQVDAAVAVARQELGRRDDVVAIRAGYRFEDGMITPQRAVVIAVRNKQTMATLADRGVTSLPSVVAGIRVDVTNATFEDVLRGEGVLEAPQPRGHNYAARTDPPFRLDRVKARMKVVLHAGPDAGWPQLRAFLKRTRRSLSIGMFEYTAPHVVEAGLRAVAGENREMLLVIQKGETIGEGEKAADIPDEETVRRFMEAKGPAFSHAWASLRFKNGIQFVNPSGIFDSSYHIKVAVRDGDEVWLSSGSWQSSNQPAHDPIQDGDTSPPLLRRFNREWHAVIAHKGIAQVFEAHLRQDRVDALAAPMPEAAIEAPDTYVWIPIEYLEATPESVRVPPRYFEPLVLDRVVDVQPILSPDNYLERTLELLQGAERSIYFQNQSFKIRKTRPEGYERLLRTLLEKQKGGLDVRIIFRPFQDIRSDIEALTEYGFDVGRVRLDTKCHTKGIVVDSRAVLIGSHNWTNAGTSYNRDASLLFHDEEAARYFESLFLYDWSRAAPPRINENLPAPRIARADEVVPPPGMVKVRLVDLELE